MTGAEILFIVAASLLLAAVHAISPYLAFLDKVPRSRWLSAAGGISVAYVFVHLLPELGRLQNEVGIALFEAETELFVVALTGLVIFYSLERWAKSHCASDERDREMPLASFRLHLGAFAFYNLIIGYLLEERLEDGGMGALASFTLAMALHFVVNDRALYAHHGSRYLSAGRWVLAVAAIGGALIALIIALPHTLLAIMTAFLGGGVVLNVLKEELPEEHKSSIGSFVTGAALYAAFLHLA